MKNITSREIMAIVIIIVVLIVSYAGCTYYKNLKRNYEQIAKINAGLENKIKTYTDENGTLHTQIEKITVDAAAYRDVYSKQTDSLAKLLGIKAKNITELTTLVTEYKGKIRTRTDTAWRFDTVRIPGKDSIRIDTIPVYKFPYRDRFMKFDGELVRGVFTADYEISDSLTITEYNKGTGFLGLGRRKSYIDISASNPDFTIRNAKNIELTKSRTKNWSLGPYVGYGYNGAKWSPSVGISIQKPLIRF